MNEMTYVSSINDRVKRQKLNNVIESLDCFISCTTNNKTLQNYGEMSYCGAIVPGQVVEGSRRPRRSNQPILTTTNAYVGSLNDAGNLIINCSPLVITGTSCTYTTNKTGTPSASDRTNIGDVDKFEVVSHCSNCCVVNTNDLCVLSCDCLRHTICCTLWNTYAACSIFNTQTQSGIGWVDGQSAIVCADGCLYGNVSFNIWFGPIPVHYNACASMAKYDVSNECICVFNTFTNILQNYLDAHWPGQYYTTSEYSPLGISMTVDSCKCTCILYTRNIMECVVIDEDYV